MEEPEFYREARLEPYYNTLADKSRPGARPVRYTIRCGQPSCPQGVLGDLFPPDGMPPERGPWPWVAKNRAGLGRTRHGPARWYHVVKTERVGRDGRPIGRRPMPFGDMTAEQDDAGDWQKRRLSSNERWGIVGDTVEVSRELPIFIKCPKCERYSRVTPPLDGA